MSDSEKLNSCLFDFDLFCVIVMVVDCGSFIIVVVCLYLIQLIVSQKVCCLEEMVGYCLLECGNCDVLLIDVGDMLFGYVCCLLVLNDELVEVLFGVMVVLMVCIGVLDDFVVGCIIE